MSAALAQPLTFGPAHARLFGWLHAPDAARAGGLGLVVCAPFGFEEVCAHRSLRLLAEAAAAQGIATLRFDLAGTGQSQGDEIEPGQWPAWLRSVHDAIEQLKRRSGVQRVALVGLRLGATLAALAAAPRDDIVGLLAIAPVASGREHLRELRLLGATATGDGPDHADLESAGFVMTAATVDALRRIDLARLDAAPAPRVHLFERDDLPAADAWPAALAERGVLVRRSTWPGYPALMTNPQDAVTPTALIDAVVATAIEWSALPATARPQSPIDVDPPRRDHLPAFDEHALRLDAAGTPLFGMLTRPAQVSVAGGRAVLMLNAGAVHAIGPNRLWVTLARRWAWRGVTVLRLDLSGIGDSPARRGQRENRVYSRAAADDIAVALAWLKRQPGIERCAVMGLCSGAFHTLQAAIVGQDVDLALMINPLTFDWEDCQRLGQSLNEFELIEMARRYRRTMRSADTWRRLLRGELDLPTIARALSGRARSAGRQGWLRLQRALHLEPDTALGRELQGAAQRGVRLRFVFAQGAPGDELLQRLAGPALATLSARAQLSIDRVPQADHTFTARAARARLVEVLDALLFAPAPATARATSQPTARAPRPIDAFADSRGAISGF
ncbi:MAG TPA: alpha/beta hydrolase [Burkholderiaceae bacterium]|nr:alpha/beta hydrolase [Burkholderiaceae bacterium]